MITFTFPDFELIDTEPPGEPPPARFDADPDVSAEIAVERDLATDQEREWVEWLGETPLAIETGNTIEVEMTAEQYEAGGASYTVNDDAPVLGNPDGTFTRLDSAIPPDLPDAA